MMTMKQTLENIAELADIAGNPEWNVTQVPVNQSAPRNEIRRGALNGWGQSITLDFGTDTASAHLAAACVTAGPEMAAGLLALLAMAESLPEEADGHARAFAKAVTDLVESLPEVETGGQVAP